MKKQNSINTTLHTNIEDISAIGNELSDEHLRLVAGAAKKGRTYTGRTYINCCWYKRDYND